jgi:hypothetical protein
VDDETDVEALFRQQSRRDMRAQRFVMDSHAARDRGRDSAHPSRKRDWALLYKIDEKTI